MQYHYETRGVCSRAIDINLDEATGIIRNVQFTGDQHGNNAASFGIAKTILRIMTGNIDNPGGEFVGQPAEEVIRRLQGIRCGMRPTSCPDQLAEALTEALEQI